ncbi:MAG: alpha/beta hydrolase fold domain-containing protein [Isosphaeraceae bacterium]
MSASPRRGYVVVSVLLLIGLVCWRTWASSLAGAEPEKPPPDFVDVRYGPHERHVLDLWKASPRSGKDGATPMVIFYHGGGFRGGDKASVPGWLVTDCLAAGISVASANYRLSQSAPFPAPMLDGARAIQFLRSRAGNLGLDPSRFAASGSSAGAGIALWVGFHDDLADRASRDPVARQSSRVRCLGVDGAQTSYDPRFIRTLIGGRAHEHSALRPFFGIKSDSDLSSPSTLRLYEDASPLNHASTDDPPVILFYKEPDKPLPRNAKPGSGIHHPRFGAALKDKLDQLGVECILHHQDEYPSEADPDEAEYRDMVDFFVGRLRK